MMSRRPWHDLPLPPIRSELAYPGDPESFHVEEIPLYEPCGEGEHLYLKIEKRGIDTPALVNLLSRSLGVPTGAIGWAGRKDRHATSRQWISLPRQGVEQRMAEFSDPAVTVLESRPHRNKLRMGHLRGNRFRLLLRGEADIVELRGILEGVRSRGMPNYFGPQRFGRQGDNHLRGRELLESGRRGRGREARFLHSAFQSALFNRVCAERAGMEWELLTGDLAWIHAKGAVFRVEDPEAERARGEALEISPSGPMPGKKMMEPAAEAGELEARLMEEEGWSAGFAGELRGGRRPLRVPVEALTLEPASGGYSLGCVLPSGSYASVLLALLGVRAPESSTPDLADAKE